MSEISYKEAKRAKEILLEYLEGVIDDSGLEEQKDLKLAYYSLSQEYFLD